MKSQKQILKIIGAAALVSLAAACAAEDAASHRSAGGPRGFDNTDVARNDADALPIDPSDPSDKPKLPPKHPPMKDDTAQPLPPSQSDSAKLKTALGVRNFRQINLTMSALTGVPTTDATVQAAFADLQTSLPDGNDLRAFIGSHQVSIVKLAVEYCDRAIETPALRAALIPGFNFDATVPAAFDEAGKSLVARSLVEKFWGMGLDLSPSDADSIGVARGLLDDVLAGKATNSAQVTKNVVKGVCAAVLASGPVTFL